MKLFFFLTVLAILHNHVRLVSPQGAQIKSLLDNIYKTITKEIPALPAKLATATVNLICTTFIDEIKKHIPSKFQPKFENIRLQFRTPCGKRLYPLSNLAALAADKAFDRKKKTVIAATGWTTEVDNDQHDKLAKAYNCRGDTNYLALDVDDYVQTLYTWSSQNSDVIGKLVAEGLKRLSSFIDIANLQLIGHSLGAQIMGSAARSYRALTGKSLPHVTGLDPALPCFSMHKGITTLSAKDANFVDIIHTNPGVLGQYETYGHVGFYVGGMFPIKNGCVTTVCSHSIAVSYYVESIYPNNANNFIAKQCQSTKRLVCNGPDTVMGYAVSHGVRGTYMLDVNSKAPYGKNSNAKYTDPKSSKCGICK